MNNVKLPPLPDWTDWHPTLVSMSVSEIKNSIQAYATAAIEADRQARGNAVASAVSSEPDTEREKWLASLFPEDRMFEEIDQMARESYKRHHSSTRGQMLVRSDSWDSHVVWATKRWIEENEPLPAAPLPQQQPKPQPTPSAPIPPQRPPLQYSTEDYKAPLPDKSKLLNEGK